MWFYMAESDVLTVREVANYLRISLPTAYKLIHSGKLPHVFLGCRIVIPREALALWLSSHITGGEAYER